MKKSLLMWFSFMLVFHVWAQERKISGTVTASEDGSPLPGVNVLLKGTTFGSVTDVDGKFVLEVPSSGGTLVFSFIGLESKEVEIGTQTVIDVAISQDVKQLSEVVVTAQGILKTRNELSYAAQTVSGENISNARDNNFINSLSGKVAGVQIQKNNSMGGSTNIIIRGWKSLSGSNQALIVVDGVPVDNSTYNVNNYNSSQSSGTGRPESVDFGNVGADVNPDDIETTTVLKGPAATALYGSRASNGVVYITTKKGRKKGIGVTLNTGVTFGTVDKSTLPKYQKQYGGGYEKYYGPNEDGYFDQSDVDGDGILDNVVPTREDASVGAQFNPNMLVYQWDSYGDPTSPNYKKATPWVAAKNDPTEYFETAVTYSNNITIDGGTEKGFFKLGYTTTDETGVQPNSRLKKDYLNFSASYEVAKNLKASATINFSNTEGKGRYALGYGGNNNLSSFREWWQMNVDVKQLEAAYLRTKKNITWNWGPGFPEKTDLIYWDNPYFAAYENYSTDSRLRYLGNVRLDYQITKWLSLMGRVSLDSYGLLQEERTAVGSIYFPAGQYMRRNRTFSEYNYDLMLQVDKKLGADLAVKGALGMNLRKTTQDGISASTNGGLSVPKIYALSNSINPIEAPNEKDFYINKEVDGFFADAEVGFKDFVFLNGSFRRDVSSTLPKGSNAYNYGQISTSFVFSKFLEENPVLTFGKLRVNYAEVGADAPFNALADLYDKPTAYGGVPLFSLPSTKNNSALKPERTQSYEIGLEATFLDGLIGIDVNYFNSKSVDQIIPVTLSTATGYNSKYVNAGTLENRGWEATLTGTPVKSGAFKWDVSLNWTRIRNEVTELFGDVKNMTLSSFFTASGSSNAPLHGRYGTIYGTDYVYHENGGRIINPTTGRYQRTTTVTNPIGNINPDWNGGIQNTLSYKDVSLSFLVDVKHGGDVLSIDMYYGLATGLYEETAGLNELGKPVRSAVEDGGGILLKGVKPDGSPNTTRVNMLAYPQMGTATTGPTSRYVYDASYVKLREVLLTYSLPSSIIGRLSPLRSLAVSAVGRNLWIIHKNLPYADPEDNVGAGNIQGIQSGALPAVRTIGFNVKATF